MLYDFLIYNLIIVVSKFEKVSCKVYFDYSKPQFVKTQNPSGKKGKLLLTTDLFNNIVSNQLRLQIWVSVSS